MWLVRIIQQNKKMLHYIMTEINQIFDFLCLCKIKYLMVHIEKMSSIINFNVKQKSIVIFLKINRTMVIFNKVLKKPY